MAGTQASEATPFFERLCPAMTIFRVDLKQKRTGIAAGASLYLRVVVFSVDCVG